MKTTLFIITASLLLLSIMSTASAAEIPFVFDPLPHLDTIWTPIISEHGTADLADLAVSSGVFSPEKSAFHLGRYSVRAYLALFSGNPDNVLITINEVIETARNTGIADHFITPLYDIFTHNTIENAQNNAINVQHLIENIQIELLNHNDYNNLLLMQAGVWVETVNRFSDMVTRHYGPEQSVHLFHPGFMNSLLENSRGLKHRDGFPPDLAEVLYVTISQMNEVFMQASGSFTRDQLNRLNALSAEIISIMQ